MRHDLVIDPATLARYATASLTRPEEWSRQWPPAYDTHGCVAGWAEKSGDLLAESNYLTMLAACEGGVAWDETAELRQTTTGEPDVLDGSGQHFAWGGVRTLFVRVYADVDRTVYTGAFLQAAQCLRSLEEYPVLDESDYSERENEAWQELVTQEVDYRARASAPLGAADTEAIKSLLYKRLSEDGDLEGVTMGEDLDPDVIERLWTETVDTFYGNRLAAYWRQNDPTPWAQPPLSG